MRFGATEKYLDALETKIKHGVASSAELLQFVADYRGIQANLVEAREKLKRTEHRLQGLRTGSR